MGDISWIEKVIDVAESRGYARGKMEATSIALCQTGYGSRLASVVVYHSQSFLEVRRWLKQWRWRNSGDNPGSLYSQGSKLIHIERDDDGTLCCVALVSSYYDI